MSIDYGVKDIKTLEGIEAIRLRPGIRYGKWDHMGNCSYCNKNIYKDIDGTIYSCYEPPFCPNCGAQMYEELPAAVRLLAE